MFRTLGIVCAALALFSIAGGHWALLQGVAWARMMADYSQQSGSLATGIEQTFDGEHPCELCRKIQAGKEKEKPGHLAAAPVKEDAKAKALALGIDVVLLERVAGRVSFPSMAVLPGPSRALQPPTPPPRAALLAA